MTAPNPNQDTSGQLSKAPPSDGTHKSDPSIARWVRQVYRARQTWRATAEALGISSAGLAQHIAEGRCHPTDDLRRRWDQLALYRRAGRWLRGRVRI